MQRCADIRLIDVVPPSWLEHSIIIVIVIIIIIIHMPKPVYEEGDDTVLWNQAVHRDREVTANRSDIITKNKEEKTCTLVGMAITADRNVVKN
jgi:hypothetical protein